MSTIPIPVTASEITPDWIQLVTGHIPTPDSLQIKGDIQAGFGFLSSVSRVTFKTPGDPPTHHSIIVKLLPTNSKFTEYALCENAEQREIHCYNLIFPDILKAVPTLEENVCKFYYGAYQPSNPSKNLKENILLVMEDLKASHFDMMSFSGNGSAHVINSLITFMARLHYAGEVVSVQKDKPLSELYPFLTGISNNTKWENQMDAMSEANFIQLQNLLKTQNISESVWKRYEKLKPFTRQLYRKVDTAGMKMAGLIHGDAWPPNIMVHQNLPVKVLDWQFVGHRDPTYDLSFMLQSVLPADQFTAENMRKLVRQYWTEFEALCEQGQYGDKIKRRKWPEFEQFFFTWASAFGYLIFFPALECLEKDFAKYANVIRVLCEEVGLPEFLQGICETTGDAN